MPLKESALRKLTGEELYAIVISPAFFQQHEQILLELQSRSDQLSPRQFQEVHKDCEVVIDIHGFRPVRFVDIDFVADGYEIQASLKCKLHEVASQVVEKGSLNGRIYMSDMVQ